MLHLFVLYLVQSCLNLNAPVSVIMLEFLHGIVDVVSVFNRQNTSHKNDLSSFVGEIWETIT